MRGKRMGTGAALLVGGLAAAGLAFAPTAAAAVTPTTATFTANCGIFGGGSATLTATQSGSVGTMTLTSSAITAPLAISANSIASTLTMVNSTGANRVFSGTVNPAMAVGSSITVGPLTGTVAAGDSLDIYGTGGGLTMVIFGITVTCTATGPQSPGPFVYT